MGLKSFQTNVGREALELECDGRGHRDKVPTAWFDCGSHSDNLGLALAAGWTERRNARGTWFCPQCTERMPTSVSNDKAAPGMKRARISDPRV
jgi:hypothetical protein